MSPRGRPAPAPPCVALRTDELDVAPNGWLAGREPLETWHAGTSADLIAGPLPEALRRLSGLPGGFLAGLLPYPGDCSPVCLPAMSKPAAGPVADVDFSPTPPCLLLFDHRNAALPSDNATERFEVPEGFRPCLSARDYQKGVARVLDYLRAGDAYQVNLAQRFSARCTGHPWDAFLRTFRNVRPSRAGWMDLGDRQVLCFSPESFLDIDGATVRTRPIKGTRARGATPDADRMIAEDLRGHAKDRAENVMIVDLLRNDLGRVCRPGSIRVTGLFEVETHDYVHHLVSTVEGTLLSGAGPAEALAAGFPGGSITGAPKRRAMQIIRELEPYSRDIYCGSMFWALPDGRFGSNICIRSFLVAGGRVHGWSGAGIVADSDPAGEHEECLSKLSRLMALVSGSIQKDLNDNKSR